MPDEQELVMVKESTPAPQIHPQHSISGNIQYKCFRLVQTTRTCHGVVLPTFYTFIGVQDTPWNVLPSKTVKAEQAIWDTVYNIEHMVTEDGLVYGVVTFIICLVLLIIH